VSPEGSNSFVAFVALLVSRFYFIKLHALTAVKDWPSLEAFAKLRKSPIGYEPFVTHLVEKGHLKEGAKYVPRCEQKNRVVRPPVSLSPLD
jgi:hypothetical protein